jgi:hypothetical protein
LGGVFRVDETAACQYCFSHCNKHALFALEFILCTELSILFFDLIVHPTLMLIFLCICAESIVLVWPSSYSNLLNSINNLLLTLSDVYTQCLQEVICTSLSPFETLIAKAIKSSNVRIWWL